MADQTLDATVESGRIRKIDSSWDVARDTGAPIFFLNDQNALTAGAFTTGSYHVFQARFRFDLSGVTVSPINSAKVLVPLPTDGIVGSTVFTIQLWGVPWDGTLDDADWYPQSTLLSTYTKLAEIPIADLVENTTIEFDSAEVADWVNNGASGGYVGFLIAHGIQFQGTPTASEDTVNFDLGAQLFVSDVGAGTPVSAAEALNLEWDRLPVASVSTPFSGDADLANGAQVRPFSSAEPVVPNDSADLPGGPSFLVADVSGHIAVQLADGTNRTFGIVAGQVVQFPVKRVLATGTTATGIKALR